MHQPTLEEELRDAYEGQGNMNRVTFAEWVEAMAANTTGTLQQAARQFLRESWGYDITPEGWDHV